MEFGTTELDGIAHMTMDFDDCDTHFTGMKHYYLKSYYYYWMQAWRMFQNDSIEELNQRVYAHLQEGH